MAKVGWILAALCCAAVGARAAPSADEQTLYYFCSQPNCVDGANPYGPVTTDGAGNLYGTTTVGGSYNLGVVFKLAPDGTESVLHSFKGGTDGAAPYSGVVLDSAGNLYGTTTLGGGSTQCNGGCGTAYKLAPDGTETILHAFCLKGKLCSDGILPYGGVTLDAVGNVYGTTEFGSIDKHLDNGIVFRLSPDGKEKILWSFSGSFDGANPTSGVFLDGNYGILGTNQAGVYRIRRNGRESMLYEIDSHIILEGARSGLTPDGMGNFYGTTAGVGGVVYEFTPPHQGKILHTFGGNGSDGAVQDAGVAYYNGNLYGVSIGDGVGTPYGIIFQLAPSGVETFLYTFGTKGDFPDATPLIANGYLYDTTTGIVNVGGTCSVCGTVFRYGPLN